MINNRADFVLLQEVADVLSDHAMTRCSLATEFEDDAVRIQIAVPRDAGLDVTELGHALAYLAGLGQVRAFATHYGIPPAELNRLLEEPAERWACVTCSNVEHRAAGDPVTHAVGEACPRTGSRG